MAKATKGGRAVRAAMKRHGHTAAHVERAIGKSSGYVTRLVNGEYAHPKADVTLALARLYPEEVPREIWDVEAVASGKKERRTS